MCEPSDLRIFLGWQKNRKSQLIFADTNDWTLINKISIPEKLHAHIMRTRIIRIFFFFFLRWPSKRVYEQEALSTGPARLTRCHSYDLAICDRSQISFRSIFSSEMKACKKTRSTSKNLKNSCLYRDQHAREVNFQKHSRIKKLSTLWWLFFWRNYETNRHSSDSYSLMFSWIMKIIFFRIDLELSLK